MVKAEGFGTGLERCQRLADGGVVQRRQPQPADRPAIAAMLDQLAGDHLAFTVGVGGDDQLAGFAEQAFDCLELAGGLGFDQHLPLLGNDRQVGQHPALVPSVVAVGWGGLEQMADAPGNGNVGADPAAVAAAVGTEDFGDVFGLGGLFAEKQAHAVRSMAGKGHRMRRIDRHGKFYLYGYTARCCHR
ncbi:hypothetical protein D3C81_1031110 [compost metagenome]